MGPICDGHLSTYNIRMQQPFCFDFHSYNDSYGNYDHQIADLQPVDEGKSYHADYVSIGHVSIFR